MYSEVMGTDVRFPRSIVVDKRASDAVRARIKREVETAVALVPASDVLRPRRKEDFRKVRADSIQEVLDAVGGGQHLLITESPLPAFSGHLARHGDAWLLEWVSGGFERLNSDVEVHRVFGGEQLWPSHLSRRSLAVLIERIERRFPGAVVEWLQDDAGVVWIYDATLSTGSSIQKPPEASPLDSGTCVGVGEEQIQALRKPIKLPMSVYAEHDEVKEALQLDLAGVVPGVPASGDFFISASYPAMELAPFVFYPGMRGFVFRRGSILCHLALIARERGLFFRIACA